MKFLDILCPLCGEALAMGPLPTNITPSGAKVHARCAPCNLDAWLDRRGKGRYSLSHFRPGRPLRVKRVRQDE